jgi:hypothetical protein
MYNLVVFDFVATGAANETKAVRSEGEIMGVWVDHTSGTPTLTLSIEAYNASTTVYTKASPADGAFNPVRRMQTTAGVDNSGAAEFHRFFLPDGGFLKLDVNAAWTGKVYVALR